MTQTRKPFPKTAAQFLAAITPNMSAWRITTEPAEGDDQTARTRTVFSLMADEGIEAAVHFEHGRLIVSMRNAYGRGRDYWFALGRLRENDRSGWTWQKQIGEKCWAMRQHVRLLDALDELWPAAPADGEGVAA